jgi:hypothetical protein
MSNVVPIASEFRTRARLMLDNPGLLGGDREQALEHAHRQHATACAAHDSEAITLWARVVWRILEADRRYDWLRRDPRQVVKPNAPAMLPDPPPAPAPPPMPPPIVAIVPPPDPQRSTKYSALALKVLAARRQ